MTIVQAVSSFGVCSRMPRSLLTKNVRNILNHSTSCKHPPTIATLCQVLPFELKKHFNRFRQFSQSKFNQKTFFLYHARQLFGTAESADPSVSFAQQSLLAATRLWRSNPPGRCMDAPNYGVHTVYRGSPRVESCKHRGARLSLFFIIFSYLY